MTDAISSSSAKSYIPLPKDILSLVTTNLTVRDCFFGLLGVDKTDNLLLSEMGFRHITCLKISAMRLPEFSPSLTKLPKLSTIQPFGLGYPKQVPELRGKSLHGLKIEEDFIIPENILKMMRAIPEIHSLYFNFRIGVLNLIESSRGHELQASARDYLTHLKHFKLSGLFNDNDTGLLKLLQSSEEIESVTINNTSISNNDFRELAKKKQLAHLDLGCASGNVDYNILTQGKNLTHFTPNDSIKAPALITILQGNPGITHLNLAACKFDQVTDEVMIHLPQGLQSLHLPYYTMIYDAGFESLIQKCPNLKSLKLGKLPGVSLNALKTMKDHCPLLEEFRLYKRPDLDDAFINDLRTRKTLTVFSLE